MLDAREGENAMPASQSEKANRFRALHDSCFVIGNAWDAGSARINFQKSQTPVTPPFGTALGWAVPALRESVRALAGRGVVFERFYGMEQDEIGVWSPAAGHGVAWFKDPDGNLLSVSGPI